MKIYDMLFLKSKVIRPANAREINVIYDPTGNSGKLSFFKFLFYKNSTLIGRIRYGNGGQLPTSVLNMGAKKIYLIDLTRTLEESLKAILSTIEKIKNGIISINIYGNSRTLLIEIPTVSINTNTLFDLSFLSKDRWRVFEITEKKDLK